MRLDYQEKLTIMQVIKQFKKVFQACHDNIIFITQKLLKENKLVSKNYFLRKCVLWFIFLEHCAHILKIQTTK